MEKRVLEVTDGYWLHPQNGCLERGHRQMMATEGFYLADRGTRIHLQDNRYRYAVACYNLEMADKYIHTYDYAPEQIWGTYQVGSLQESFMDEDYIFNDRCYFRVCLRRMDGETITSDEAANVENIISVKSLGQSPMPKVFWDEVQRVADKVKDIRSEGDLVLAVLTDTHATVNGTWQDTAANLKALQEKVSFDGVIHLGDMTDGTVSKAMTRFYVSSMLNDLNKLNVPIHIVLGNHDANYFHGNPEPMPLHEQAELYQGDVARWKQAKDKTYYFADYPQQQLRCFYLSAYQNESRPRYGFDLTQISWVRETLKDVPKDWRVMIFSHDAPLAKLDPWSDEIRNGNLLMQALEGSQANILAYIHGHAHADYVYNWQGIKDFPIISLGCAKCEDMLERKVEGSFTPPRELGKTTQELWDVLIIKNNGRLHFIRFGAGHDRNI